MMREHHQHCIERNIPLGIKLASLPHRHRILRMRLPLSVWLMGVMVLGATGCGKKDVSKASSSDLISQLESEDRYEVLTALAVEGESAIPKIQDAFAKAEGKPEVQSLLARAVWQMKRSPARTAALKQMQETTKDPTVRERVAGYVKE